MRIKEIRYNEAFEKQFSTLPKSVCKKAIKAELLLKANPFHPSLRLHKLKGRLSGAWSVSVSRSHRIVFKPLENGVVLFTSVGTHAIYDSD